MRKCAVPQDYLRSEISFLRTCNIPNLILCIYSIALLPLKMLHWLFDYTVAQLHAHWSKIGLGQTFLKGNSVSELDWTLAVTSLEMSFASTSGRGCSYLTSAWNDLIYAVFLFLRSTVNISKTDDLTHKTDAFGAFSLYLIFL